MTLNDCLSYHDIYRLLVWDIGYPVSYVNRGFSQNGVGVTLRESDENIIFKNNSLDLLNDQTIRKFSPMNPQRP